MSQARLLSGWPLPRWWPAVVALLVGAVSFSQSRDLLAADWITWAAVSARWHEAVWLSGPVAAAGAAAVGVSVFVRSSPVTAPLRPRVTAGLFAAHGLALAGWVCAAHVLALLPVQLAAASRATAGGLHAQDVAIGLGGLIEVTVAGLAVGAAVGHWLAVPAVGLVAFVMMGLPNEPLFRPLGLLEPVRQFVATPRFETSTATTVFTLATFTVVTVAAVQLAGWITSRGSVRRAGPAAAVWTASAVTLGVVAFVWRPELAVVDRPVPRVCGTTHGVRVCVHQANQPILADTLHVTGRLHAAGLGPLIDTVTDVDAAEWDQPRAGEALIRVDPGPHDPRDFAQNVADQVADQVSAVLTPPACLPHQPVADADLALAVRARLLHVAGFGRVADQTGSPQPTGTTRMVGRFTPHQLRVFIARHAEEIRTCQLTAGDLPVPPASR